MVPAAECSEICHNNSVGVTTSLKVRRKVYLSLITLKSDHLVQQSDLSGQHCVCNYSDI